MPVFRSTVDQGGEYAIALAQKLSDMAGAEFKRLADSDLDHADVGAIVKNGMIIALALVCRNTGRMTRRR